MHLSSKSRRADRRRTLDIIKVLRHATCLALSHFFSFTCRHVTAPRDCLQVVLAAQDLWASVRDRGVHQAHVTPMRSPGAFSVTARQDLLRDHQQEEDQANSSPTMGHFGSGVAGTYWDVVDPSATCAELCPEVNEVKKSRLSMDKLSVEGHVEIVRSGPDLGCQSWPKSHKPLRS
ncbi:hypothetical protein RRG08_028850 [Elysia crispata]|uniref:Uncharacterized protein n=1 Tax=Elysia crispata TaxID=231223 RepID=A0AAE0YZ00_9GAST|nr:hypothetical protein RRG08_028850 [Elysia crispata]